MTSSSVAPSSSVTDTPDVRAHCEQLTSSAVTASRALANTSGAQRTAALHAVARRLGEAADAIIAANARDLDAGGKNGLSDALLGRLGIDPAGVAKMARSVDQIADQIDPVGQVIDGYARPNGLNLAKVRVPIGIVLIIYESRPNVTSDAAALCIKSGNVVILRGGKEAVHSNRAIAACVGDALAEAGLARETVQLVQTTDRAAVGELLRKVGRIDLAIPRGGESLIKAVVEQAHIPVIKHYAGNCHVYVDDACDDQMAVDICINAKTQRPGVCNAAETILMHADAARRGLLARVCEALAKNGCEIRGDDATRAAFANARPACEDDWSTEFLDLIVAVRVVDDLDQAIDHINRYGSQHTDAIVTSRIDHADMFTRRVDSANVFVNCSTRFSDGGEYGLGAEIGISTDKLHARGPMGAADLTTYKWIVRGDGQLR